MSEKERECGIAHNVYFLGIYIHYHIFYGYYVHSSVSHMSIR